MKKNKNILFFLFTSLIAVLIPSLIFIGCSVSQDNGENMPDGGRAISDFTLPDLEGNSVTLSSLKGSVVVLNFWATWCPPCKAEIPDFIAVYDEYQDKNVVFLGISSEETDLLLSFAEEYGMNYPVLVDKSGDVFRAYKVEAIPQTYIVDTNGEIVFEQIGMISKSQLIAAINEALN